MPNLTPRDPMRDALDAAERLVKSVRRWHEVAPETGPPDGLTSLRLIAEGCAAAIKTARERPPGPAFRAGHILPWHYTGPHQDDTNGGTYFTLKDAVGAWIGDVRTKPVADLLVALVNISG